MCGVELPSKLVGRVRGKTTQTHTLKRERKKRRVGGTGRVEEAGERGRGKREVKKLEEVNTDIQIHTRAHAHTPTHIHTQTHERTQAHENCISLSTYVSTREREREREREKD